VFGDSQFNPRSRFIDEIPTHLLHEIASAPPAWDERRNGERAAWPPSERSHGRDTTADAGAHVEYRGEGIRIIYDDEDGLRVGRRVRHPVFGVGTVQRVEGSGDRQKASVHFRSVGIKKLVVKFAGLEPA